MAEINLLQPHNEASYNKSPITTVATVVAIVLVLIMLGMYGFLYLSDKKIAKAIETEKTNQDHIQSEIKTNKEYPELLLTQRKVSLVNDLLNHHVDWSKLIPFFGTATYPQVQYETFTAESKNFEDHSVDVVYVKGSAPDFYALDKFIKGMRLKDFSDSIKDVKVITSSLDDKSKGIKYELAVEFNRKLINANH